MRRTRNTHYKTIVKHDIRLVRDAISAEDPEKAQKALRNAISVIGRVASKGILHRNTASRKIARLSKAVRNMTDRNAS